MKTLNFHLILALFILSCNQTEKIDRQVVITGEVKDYDIQSEYQSLQFHVKNPFGQQISHTIYLDDNGYFSITLEQFYPQEYYMVFKEHYSFYISPGDSIHITIDSRLFNDNLEEENDQYNYIQISGDAARVNKDYFKYMQFLRDSIWDWEKDRDASINLKPNEYKTYIEQRTKIHSEKVERFVSKNNTCKQFQDFVYNSVQYRALDDLMRYRWHHPYFNKIKRDSFVLQPEYFDFLQETEFNNEELAISNSFLAFLHEYSMYFNDQYLTSDTLIKIRKYFENNENIKGYQMRLNNILDNTSGFIKEILLAKFFYQFLDWNDPETYDTLYNPEYFTKLEYSDMLERKHTELIENLKNPEYYTDKILNDLTLFDNNILKSVISKYPDKVIYLDFWAPWCGPCIGELEHSNELHEQYKGKDLVFVYLANRCSEKSWKITIAKHNIKGKHILLEDDQYKQLSNKLKISGIPHYVIIDKKGVIVNSNAPRPSETEKLTTILNQLLE